MKIKYILLGILVNFVWGFAYLIPYYLSTTNPIIITVGRYLIYGILSVCLLINSKSLIKKINFQNFKLAFLFAFAGNIGYYFFLTSAIKNIGMVLPSVIIGTVPITTLIYGNITNKEIKFRKLFPPITLILLGLSGLSFLKYDSLEEINSIKKFVLGTLLSLGCLILWTWYGVRNANFLTKNPGISSYEWSIIIGICCLLQAFIVVIYFSTVFSLTGDININVGNPLASVLIGCFILAILVSWLATSWWNTVSRNLPVSLSGQLIVFEVISSLIYDHIINKTLPQPLEVMSVLITIIGVLNGVKAFNKRHYTVTNIE